MAIISNNNSNFNHDSNNNNSHVNANILKKIFTTSPNKNNLELNALQDNKNKVFIHKNNKRMQDNKQFVNNTDYKIMKDKAKTERKVYKPYKDNKLLDPSEFSIVEEENTNKKIYVSKKGFIGENRRKPVKTYADEYEREEDFKINIFKKNRYATPYFQEKKRRNDFYGKKGKPKVEESWKKKKKY